MDDIRDVSFPQEGYHFLQGNIRIPLGVDNHFFLSGVKFGCFVNLLFLFFSFMSPKKLVLVRITGAKRLIVETLVDIATRLKLPILQFVCPVKCLGNNFLALSNNP